MLDKLCSYVKTTTTKNPIILTLIHGKKKVTYKYVHWAIILLKNKIILQNIVVFIFG